MKILNAIHAQSIGGVDQMFCNYTAALSKKHEVSLLISDNGNDNYKKLNVKKIFKLKNHSQILDCLHLLLILLTYRPDIIICHSNRLMKWMKILHYFTKIKSVAVNHGISFKQSLNCDYIISINQQIADMVTASGFASSKSFVVSNVIEIDQNYCAKKIKNPLIIAIYGRIEPRKGFDILIKAAEILQKNNYDFRLKIGGFEVAGGYNLNSIKDLAKKHGVDEKCNFVGVVLDKKSFFADVDILCVPSREEPFGLVILEGFLHSTLTISSDSEGGKLLIKNGVDGLLFANEDYNDLAQKIILASQSEENYCHFTKMAYSKLLEHFSLDSLANNFEQVLWQIKQ